ncbi:hypothetical protein [Massilia sp. METH4]|uniref:hypothetical protein n=1 Tax=Massilia sp. METH4 TaxID=3123041 RepID=UPI0030D41040
MRSDMILLTSVALVASTGSFAEQQRSTSVYTDVSGKTCIKHIDDELTGAYTLDCTGIRGYRLQVLNDDERSSVNIVTPDKKTFPLDYWDVVTPGFSSLGNKAEWRLYRQAQQSFPVALIVRLNTLDQSDPGTPKRRSILVVARISQNSACVTHTVDAKTPHANDRARQFADDVHAACLPRNSNVITSTKG